METHQIETKWSVASHAFLNKFCGKMTASFCFNTGKRFFLEVLF